MTHPFVVRTQGFTTIGFAHEGARMQPAEAARRAAIAATAQQPVSLEQVLMQQPIATVRLHQVTQLVFKPASPLERPDHEVAFSEIELHLITLGDTERQIVPLNVEAAEVVIADFQRAIDRAKQRRVEVKQAIEPDEPMPDAA